MDTAVSIRETLMELYSLFYKDNGESVIITVIAINSIKKSNRIISCYHLKLFIILNIRLISPLGNINVWVYVCIMYVCKENDYTVCNPKYIHDLYHPVIFFNIS